MERTKINKPDAILTSDWHLREDTPICYTGDYQQEQWDSVDFISKLQKKYECPVLHGGDLFDHWKPSPNLLRLTILHLPKLFRTVYGQHDLPQHSLDLTHKCGINVLEAGEHLTVAKGVHWGQEPKDEHWNINYFRNTLKRVLIWHRMTYKNLLPWPGCTDPSAMKLCRKYQAFDLIITGDNHMPFTEEFISTSNHQHKTILVNPGSLMRMDADQINHRPRVYLWYAKTNTIETVFIPIVPANLCMTREHIEVKKKQDNRIDAFVERLNSEWKASLTFEENLEIFKKKNKVDPEIMSIIYESIEPIKK
jgi:DNA repair exonuclease SbcCD nuclease subunit